MPWPAEVRFIGDEGQDEGNCAHRDDETVLQANPAREYNGRQDQINTHVVQ